MKVVNNIMVMTLRGRSQTLKEWAYELTISESTIRTRVKLGWSDERALTVRPLTPIEAGHIAAKKRWDGKLLYA